MNTKYLVTAYLLLGCCLLLCNGCSDSIEVEGSGYNDATATDEERIIFAVKSGNISVIDEYMSGTPELATMYDTNGMTLLHHAAMFSQVKVADYLLDKGADINALSATGETPLAAAEDGSATEEMITFLEDNGGGL